ncbi:hypothetical protein [Acinetobacter terrae]|uniref:hypothetical protein n=1 Tax=Acinetobacter terrae TaxID=2731247 RepID=UPI0007D7587C|nr:hypothetical protein [Acinetobacter terrae]OAL80331.1 hypothetical protein AY608_05495 [Acinetobacter terrae]
MQLTKEEFIQHAVLPRSQYKRNSLEEISKRALSEQLAKEVAEFERRKKITELPHGFSYEQKCGGFVDAISNQKRMESKKYRMEAQQELLIRYAQNFEPDWLGLSKTIKGVSPSQLRRAYQGKVELVNAWPRVKKHIEGVLIGKAA